MTTDSLNTSPKWLEYKIIIKVKMSLISKSFETMKVSTRTFTATSNITMDIDKVSKFLPVYELDEGVKFKNTKKYRSPKTDQKIG